MLIKTFEMDGQDWAPVIVRSSAKKPAGGAGGSSRGGHAATAEAIRLRRLEEEDFPVPTKHLSSESRTEMIRARTAKGMSQVQLNTACAFPLHTIRDIENGKLCPTPQQMNSIKRVLGIVMKYA
jgi:ribosome-binding protein aMBF1 (putative translation factor)